MNLLLTLGVYSLMVKLHTKIPTAVFFYTINCDVLPLFLNKIVFVILLTHNI